MPFLIASAIALHVAVFAPLYLVFSLGSEVEISPLAFLGWPLLAAVLAAVLIGTLLKLTVSRGLHRPLAVAAAVAVFLYMQFYGFVWDFGIFDGRAINFGAYKTKGLIEAAAFAVIVGFALFRPRTAIQIYGRFLGILVVAGITYSAWQFATVDVQQTKLPQAEAEVPVSGIASANFFRDGPEVMRDATRLSKTNKNVIVLLLDTLQVDVFEDIVSHDPELRRQFSGFQLFTNASGHFPYTALSVPAILSGEPYTAEKESIPAYKKRIATKRVEAILAGKGADASRIPLESRANFLSAETGLCRSYATVYDLYGFRQVPVALKPYFYDQGRFQFARRCAGIPATGSEIDLAVFDKLRHDTVADANAPTIKYLHFWGAHPPATLNSDCQVRGQSRAFTEFQGQAYCMLRQTGAYLDKLRSLGVFDNTMIFVISDHGSRLGFLKKSPNKDVPFYVMSSANPSLAFHDFGDNQEFRTRPAPAMLIDIYPTILSQFNIKADAIGMDLHALADDAKRERPFTFYKGSADAQQEFLPQVERFVIAGNVRDPAAWSRANGRGTSPVHDEPIGRLVFGEPRTSKFLDLGWSAEAAKVPASWIISNPATVSGRLPQAKIVRMTVRLMNPHPDQVVTVSLNGRELASWDLPTKTAWIDKSVTFEPTPGDLDAPARIEFSAEKIVSLSNDVRKLGIAVTMIDLQPADGEGAAPAQDDRQVVNDAPLGRLPLNSPVTRGFFDSGWSVEQPDVPASWIIAKPASVTGRLPQGHSIRMSMQLMNPHPDQTVAVKLNGREIGRWELPEPTSWVNKSIVFTPTAEDKESPARIEIDVSKLGPTSSSDDRKLGIAAKEIDFDVVD